MREIPLTQGMVALVDDEDWESVAPYLWFAFRKRNTWYAATNIKREDGSKTCVHMHRLLMQRDGERREVDHIDGNGLDNRRENMRWATPAQQRRNSSKHKDNKTGFKGVCFHKERGRYLAQLTLNYERRLRAYFDTAEEAARAYDDAARELFGEFARLNFPENGTHTKTENVT